MNSPVADKICTGEFFYVTGNFVEFSDKVKSPPGRILSCITITYDRYIGLVYEICTNI